MIQLCLKSDSNVLVASPNNFLYPLSEFELSFCHFPPKRVLLNMPSVQSQSRAPPRLHPWETRGKMGVARFVHSAGEASTDKEEKVAVDGSFYY